MNFQGSVFNLSEHHSRLDSALVLARRQQAGLMGIRQVESFFCSNVSGKRTSGGSGGSRVARVTRQTHLPQEIFTRLNPSRILSPLIDFQGSNGDNVRNN